MKRKREESNFIPEENCKKSKTIDIWITATDIKNYFLKDTLVDWLKLKKDTKNTGSYIQNDIFIEKGKEFEREIVRYINEKRVEIISVSDRITEESCNQVIELMKKGVAVIHSAPFMDYKNRTKGVIDLLVRSDVLNLITSTNYLTLNEINKSCSLSDNFHYIVVDIKFSTLPLKSDGIHLLNSGNYEFYKGQLFIYNKAIGNIQGYTPESSFILGRRSKYTLKGKNFRTFDAFEKMGKVDFTHRDKHIETKVNEANKWLKDLRENGTIWSLYPPSRPELYPNMSVDSGIWNSDKKEIAERIGEITDIWNCGINQREKAFKKKVFSWRDAKCNSDILGLKGHTGKIVNSILDINRKGGKIFPQKITCDLFDWRKKENDAFIDFENFIDIFSDMKSLPIQEKTDKIFLIGVYYNGEYFKFLAKDLEDEKEIVESFIKFLKENHINKLWFWHAESIIWKRLVEKYGFNDTFIWCDLLKLFKSEPIVLQGCFDFSLKNVGKAMFKHGLININLDSKCSSGIEAGVTAWKLYKEKAPVESFSEIIKYNKYDVQLLSDILKYFRENM